jgi:hypothetical protein
MITCQKCGRGPVTRVVHVLVDGQADAGPYGRRCARVIVEKLAANGFTATRRYSRAEPDA